MSTSGCTTQDQSQVAADESTTIITDLAGREVTVKTPVDRIILQGSGSGGAFYTLFALEGRDAVHRIVGMDDGLQVNRQWIWQKYSEAVPELKDVPTVGNGKDLNIESVVALKPDVLIVAEHEYTTSTETYKKVEEAGIPVVAIDYHTETPETHQKSIEVIGTLIGKEEKAAELNEFYQAEVAKVTSRLAEIDAPEPKTYIECGSRGPDELGNSYGKYMWGALVDRCRGENIAIGVIERWGPLNEEYLLKSNPDVILFTGSYWPKQPTSMKMGYYVTGEEAKEALARYLNREGWQNLDAVKNDRVYVIHHGLSRDIWDFVPIQFIAKALYPEEFSDLDPEASLREFHERFLPVEYSGIWMLGPDVKQ